VKTTFKAGILILASLAVGLAPRAAEPGGRQKRPPEATKSFVGSAKGGESSRPVRPARVAVISGPGVPGEIADHLAARLSGIAAIELFERDRLAAVLKEQELDAMQLNGALELGQLTGVDGIVLLSVDGKPSSGRLVLRLVATGPGAVVGSENIPLPIRQVSEWMEFAAERIAALAGKLTVEKGAAVPVSVVGISSPFNTDEAYLLESRLTTMLIERLFRFPEIFVLERRSLNLAAREKEFNGERGNAFWNGAYLVEGQFNRDGSSLSMLKLELRLKPRAGGDEISLTASGPRDNLPALIERAATQIAKSVGRPQEAITWRPEAEAARYLAEAEWYLRWGLYQQARSAAETAGALGENSIRQKTAATRAIEGMLRPIPNSVVRSERDYHAFKLLKPAPTHRLDLAIEGLRKVGADLADPMVAGDRGYLTSAFWMVADVSVMLRHFSYDRNARAEHSDRLREIRARCRKVAQRVDAASRKMRIFSTSYPIRPEDNRSQRVHNVSELFDILGRFWQADLDANADWLKRRVMSAQFDRERLADFNVDKPYLVCWSVEDEMRHNQVWREVLEYWSHSSDPALRLEAVNRLFLEFPGYYDGIGDRVRDRLFEQAWKEREFIHDGTIPKRYWNSVTNRLMHRFNLPRSKEFIRAFFEKFNLPPGITNIVAGAADGDPRVVYLKTAQRFEPGEFNRRIPIATLTPEEARRLAPLMEEFGKRVKWVSNSLAVYRNMLKKAEPGRTVPELRVTNIWPDKVEIVLCRDDLLTHEVMAFSGGLSGPKLAALTRLLALRIQPGPTYSSAAAPGRHPVSPGVKRNQQYRQATGQGLAIDRFWAVPIDRIPHPTERVTGWVQKQCLYSGGSMWLAGRATYSHRGTQLPSPVNETGFLIEVPLATMQPRFTLLPASLYDRNRYGERWELQLAAGDKVLGLCRGNQLFLRSRKPGSKGWRKFGEPLSQFARLWSVNGQVLLTDETTIRIFENAESPPRLLASTRRRPPLNSVDRRPRLAIGAVGEHRGGGAVLFDWNNAIYETDHLSDSWRVYEQPTGMVTRMAGKSAFLSAPGWTKVWDPVGKRLVALYDDARQIPRSFAFHELYAVPIDGGQLVRSEILLSTRRKADGSVQIIDGRPGGSRLIVINPATLTMEARPIQISIKNYHPGLSVPYSREDPQLHWTDRGLVLAMDELAGFWWIPAEQFNLSGNRNPIEERNTRR